MATMNDVRNAVIAALYQRFPAVPIYGEDISQGLTEPCFYVKLFPTQHDQSLNRRYRRTHTFDIHYFPEPIQPYKDMHDMSEALTDVLELVPFGTGLLRGSGMNTEIIDGVLHFGVEYTVNLVRPPTSAQNMNTMKQEAKLK